MSNYNERLDDVVSLIGVPLPIEQAINAKDTAKKAINSLFKELVAEAEPGTWVDPEDTDDLEWQGYVKGVEHFKQNLLKALEEV